ncbi:YfiR family protein [Massilia sp. RP-1-19]|uniref:YfiR family protein n=1 Tax=Massilia polaris TaxID=2728846 RepID=A0A848HGB7_9BURK|nr:YfiR family protein [Massilia polaris]
MSRPPVAKLPRRRVLAGLLALAAAALGHGAAHADGGGAGLERSVKAAFLYKFLMFTEFPASAFADPAAPLVIGVAGADDMARDLMRLVAGRTVNRRPVLVRTLRDSDAPDGLHLLFVGGSDAGQLARLARPGQQAPLLIVTEAENGLQYGSVINFLIVAERVRFDVSLDAADKNKIKLSSRLLTVANHVHKGAP